MDNAPYLEAVLWGDVARVDDGLFFYLLRATVLYHATPQVGMIGDTF
ncbi:MAG: hypothetical protein GY732_01665 [Gammaproteobacteria bacterium]|nr:hypothetical protein [Gammaproteobacteria bacterium]